MILKCKMCGGDISVNGDMTIGTCQYCGSTMTLPKISSDRKARLFNKANEYRLNNEFDKAYDAYKSIVDEDEQEAEAYWGLILSEYGVEYVEDPLTKKRVPTCHRTKVQSILSSTNYKMALQYADSERKFYYQDEAEVLDRLQKNIISVSAKEQPYDVFICYKETNIETDQRTPESVVGQEIYEKLTEKGMRCFFSRISLENHIGENYEPYIYAALKSARVMVVLASGIDNCNSVWVKNEWMRFLQFMSEDQNKIIVPALVDMSPYELPSELSSFQAQDMTKVGAIQDLYYGISKILGTAPRESNSQIINELLEDKIKREKDLEKKEKFREFLVIASSILLSIISFWFLGDWFGYTDGFEKYSMFHRDSVYISVGIILVFSLISSLLGLLYGLIKGYENRFTRGSFLIGLLLCSIAILFFKLNAFKMIALFAVYTIDLFVCAIYLIKWGKLEKKELKRIYFAIIGVSLVLAFVVPKKELHKTIKVTGEYVNVRAKPSTKSSILGKAYKGDTFTSTGKELTNWYVISYNGRKAYVYRFYVKEN